MTERFREWLQSFVTSCDAQTPLAFLNQNSKQFSIKRLISDVYALLGRLSLYSILKDLYFMLMYF